MIAKRTLSLGDSQTAPVMIADLAPKSSPAFRLQADVLDELQAACLANRDIAAFHVLGETSNRRPIVGITIGTGETRVSLLAGSHADEPVGPETLRLFVTRLLRRRDDFRKLLEAVTFVVLPHVNPDGESRNRPWIREWPNPVAYLRDAVREPPGEDIEFGYPGMRRENEVVARFLKRFAPLDMHVSLHGMGFAEGGLLLIDPHWGYRTEMLQSGYRDALKGIGLGLHDHNRMGEKGFFYLGPGFTTTPSGAGMRAYFHSQGDDATAALFHDSSMEFVRSLGGDPLSLVTEIPLFSLGAPADHEPGVPKTYLEWRAALPGIRKKLGRGKPIEDALAGFFLQPVSTRDAVGVQLKTIELGIQTVLDVKNS